MFEIRIGIYIKRDQDDSPLYPRVPVNAFTFHPHTGSDLINTMSKGG